MYFKRRKIYSIAILLLTAMLFASCRPSEEKQEQKAHFEPYIISTDTDSGVEWLNVHVDEGMAYLLSKRNIVRYDLTTGERSVLVEAEGNTVICAREGYIYSYNKEQNAVIKYDSKGKIIKSYPFILEPVDANYIRVHGNLVVIAALLINNNGDSESELYKLDLSDGVCSRITDYKGKDGFSFILSLDFIDKNTIILTSATTDNFMNPIIKAYKYDLHKLKLLEEFIVPSSNTYCYNPVKNCFYYQENIGYVVDKILHIRAYDIQTHVNTTISSLNSEFLSTYGNEFGFFSVRKIFYSDDSIIFWNDLGNCFLVTDQSEREHINVLLTRNISHEMKFPIIASQFEAEYGCPVHFIEYPEDIYMDKLRTKLLAGDSDYDVFLLYSPNEDNLLSSILKYELYEPLDSYEGITNNFSGMFDGIRSMMSHNNKLFGVPYYLSSATYVLSYDLGRYGCEAYDKRITFDDIWNLCDGIIESGEKDVTVFPKPNILGFVMMFIQESIDRNQLDKDALADIFVNIKKYNDDGVLYDNSGEKKHLLDTSSVSYFYNALYMSDIPAYPEFGTVMLTGNDKRNLWILNGCAIINKYSKNKEMAANLLKLMTDSKNIYNTELYQFAMLGSDLTKYDKYNEWSADRLAYLSDLNYLFRDSGIITYDIGIITELIYTITPELLDGSITPEKAAEKIYDQIMYTFFE
ncbi:MAG: carbohydrate ABC transporter substrate-binding protein [Clostridiales bacterium]|nr:carbohydrate ABC transporter substrate-binding protein [Clostridiales bacterium]